MINYCVYPKEYNYEYKSMDTNKGREFIEKQLKQVSNINCDTLIKIKKYIIDNSQSPYKNQVLSDIDIFLKELRNSSNLLNKTFIRVSKGLNGEEKVLDIINKCRDNLKVLEGIMLNYKGKDIEYDFITISSDEVNIFEVKNIGRKGDSAKIGKSYNISINNKLYKNDIIEQVLSQKAIISNILKGFSNIKVNNHLVFANEMSIKNDSDISIINANQIYSILTNKKSSTNIADNIYEEITKYSKSKYSNNYINVIDTLEKNYELLLKAIYEIIN